MHTMTIHDGDYNGRFTLPSGEEVHGTLTLAADQPPSVSLHPELPGSEIIQGRSFPQGSRSAELVGHLFSNDEVVIGDAVLSEWFPRYVHASGRWALVGLEILQVPERRWNTLEIRITGLETILGNAISATYWPDASTEMQKFSADFNTAARYTSTMGDVSLTAEYRWKLLATDPYRFSLSNYPTATFSTDRPFTVDEWIEHWINPLFGLVTLATGERERITSALFSAPHAARTADNPSRPHDTTGRLFGSGIHPARHACGAPHPPQWHSASTSVHTRRRTAPRGTHSHLAH